jgi:hypothetical protein
MLILILVSDYITCLQINLCFHRISCEQNLYIVLRLIYNLFILLMLNTEYFDVVFKVINSKFVVTYPILNPSMLAYSQARMSVSLVSQSLTSCCKISFAVFIFVQRISDADRDLYRHLNFN